MHIHNQIDLLENLILKRKIEKMKKREMLKTESQKESLSIKAYFS